MSKYVKPKELSSGEKRIEAYYLAYRISPQDPERTALIARSGLMEVALVGHDAVRLKKS